MSTKYAACTEDEVFDVPWGCTEKRLHRKDLGFDSDWGAPDSYVVRL